MLGEFDSDLTENTDCDLNRLNGVACANTARVGKPAAQHHAETNIGKVKNVRQIQPIADGRHLDATTM